MTRPACNSLSSLIRQKYRKKYFHLGGSKRLFHSIENDINHCCHLLSICRKSANISIDQLTSPGTYQYCNVLRHKTGDLVVSSVLKSSKLISVICWLLRDFICKTERYLRSLVYLAINSLSVLNFILVLTWELSKFLVTVYLSQRSDPEKY